MGIFILLFIVYVTSILVLAGCYGEHNVSPNVWSIAILFTPIINTGLIVYLLLKTKRKEVSKFFSIKEFLNDLKDN